MFIALHFVRSHDWFTHEFYNTYVVATRGYAVFYIDTKIQQRKRRCVKLTTTYRAKSYTKVQVREAGLLFDTAKFDWVLVATSVSRTFWADFDILDDELGRVFDVLSATACLIDAVEEAFEVSEGGVAFCFKHINNTFSIRSCSWSTCSVYG